MNHAPDGQDLRLATLSALSAYLLWGAFGLYFKALDQVPAVEILTHRILWSVFFLALIVTLTRKWGDVIEILRHPSRLLLFVASALLIAINWGFYIYAVVSGQALEGSMGYFILPLVAVALGAIFFGERFSRLQSIAIGFAGIGVAYQIIAYGKPPWIALTLGLSFGFYGMLRKKAPADSMVGLFLETLIISPLALCAMAYWVSTDQFYFISATIDMQGLLLLAGPVTAIPLLLFAYGARKLRYSTIGLLQYVNPTCQFLLAIFVFKEDFDLHGLVTFGFIWLGLILYSYGTLRQRGAANS